MTPPRPLHPGELRYSSPRTFRAPTPWPGHPMPRHSPGEPPRQPVRPSFRPVPLPDRRFQKRPMTTEPRQSRLFDPMTVCIGYISPKHHAIISVTDTMLSDDVSSSDLAAVKLYTLVKSGAWLCMYAGLPTEFWELLQHLGRFKEPQTLKAAIRAAEHAYVDLTTHLIERAILAPFGLTLGKFVKDGAATFGETYFRELSEQCRVVVPETDILVTGFSSDGAPHIFETNRKRVCTIYDQLGFWAIGAGAWAALGSLYSHGEEMRRYDHLNKIVYRLCEAKFIAETARSVGSGMTLVNVSNFDGSGFQLFIAEKDPIRAAWTKQRDSPIPAEALEEIGKWERKARRLQLDQRQKAYPEPSKPS
jgi:hypothetical protein